MIGFQRSLCCLALTIAVLPACDPNPRLETPPRTVTRTFQAADGGNITSTLYSINDTIAPPPGLILIHSAGETRAVWAGLAEQAQRAGFLTIALDLRGHGDSAGVGETNATYRRFSDSDWRNAIHDVEAAANELKKEGADPNRIAIAGAGIGANLALLYGSRDPRCACVIMVSPGAEYHGIGVDDAIEAYAGRPLLLMASEGDSYSAATATALKDRSGGFCELRIYPGAAHGIALLTQSEQPMGQILTWLDTVVANAVDAADKPVQIDSDSG